uniref:Uncharacterized protein n=1 Tax=Oryza punctata TaxID=4537 RepID=A0A0E0M592_ORYPU
MTGTDEKLERLQQLLLRVHTVVEEADARYITNSKMLVQLKMLVDNMYEGYHILDTLKYRSLPESVEDVEGSEASTSWINFPSLKRLRKGSDTARSIGLTNGLDSAVGTLEAAIANMSEFVILLGGCERVSRRPYDTYLYTDNFMFGRHVEKQHIINILLQNHAHLAAPTVLPVIGGYKVGKKTLISHVCNDEQVRSYFSSILYIKEDNIGSIDEAKFSSQRILVVIEFVSDVSDEDWEKFYSSVTQMSGPSSKVIVISRLHNLARVGTTEPVYVNSLSQQEFSYLFKMLTFGSTNAEEYPQLASIANKLAIVLQGSLVTTNVVADLLRRNLDVQFWLCTMQRFKGMLANNIEKFGEHPKDMLEKEHPVHIIGFTSSSCPVPLRLMPPQVEKHELPRQNQLPNVMFGDIVAGFKAVPDEEFEIVSWESRLPPYTKYIHSVEVNVDKKTLCSTPSGKRRSSKWYKQTWQTVHCSRAYWLAIGSWTVQCSVQQLALTNIA